MAFYLPYLLIFVSISGSIWLIYKIFQTRYSLKGSKIRFKRFFLLGCIFSLIIVSSGLLGVLEGNKRVSRSILLGNVTQKYESARNKKKKEQALAQKIEKFTACYEDMNDIFVKQEKRLTDKNMETLTRLYRNLPEEPQKEYQEKYEQVKKDVQYVKDTKIEEACSDLFGDTNPWFASEEEKKEKQQSVTYERYENLFQQATNIQSPTKKETALNYLESVKEWLDQQQQN
ncbi:TPA: hypothetical protein IXN99_002514 [Enterococcus faecium]|uniref:Uncharacterized protein n=1 Tax=Enterococcus faecium TaxID=1352 RepID=G1UE01_ENTFC|nr:hypothetical protein [Enterococcus faecium]HAP5485196.1 hypothetical protein [Enterococcus faecalis]EFF28394.1 conserved hypothetical protein [Enterococcus faecium U0317]ELB74088.1 hypothetical protein OM7_05993 [Enterococcus faecium EnGen0046]MBY3661678.1 hypothetical protein [Enterococcus faecium]MCH3201730.1 hypothetical protein [Enterococcus faecium]